MNDFVDWTRIPQAGPGGIHHAFWKLELLCERKTDLEDRHYQVAVMPAGRQLNVCPVCRAKYNWIRDNNNKPRN